MIGHVAQGSTRLFVLHVLKLKLVGSIQAKGQKNDCCSVIKVEMKQNKEDLAFGRQVWSNEINTVVWRVNTNTMKTKEIQPRGFVPGTRWDDIFGDQACPTCGVPKSFLKLVSE